MRRLATRVRHVTIATTPSSGDVNLARYPFPFTSPVNEKIHWLARVYITPAPARSCSGPKPCCVRLNSPNCALQTRTVKSLAVSVKSSVANLSLEQVIEFCREQNERFRQRISSDGVFCFELFYRAIVKKIDSAHSVLRGEFAFLVRTVVQDCLADALAYKISPAKPQIVEEVVSDAFSKFYIYFRADHLLRARDLNSVLAFLKKASWSVAKQWKRDNPVEKRDLQIGDSERSDGEDIPEQIEPVDVRIAQSMLVKELLALCESKCKDDLERQIYHGIWVEGEKPAVVYSRIKDSFRDKSQFYEKWHQFKDRLRNDSRFTQLQQDLKG